MDCGGGVASRTELRLKGERNSSVLLRSPVSFPFYQGLRGNGVKAHLELALPRRNRTRDVPFLITRLNKISPWEGDKTAQSRALSWAFLGPVVRDRAC